MSNFTWFELVNEIPSVVLDESLDETNLELDEPVYVPEVVLDDEKKDGEEEGQDIIPKDFKIPNVEKAETPVEEDPKEMLVKRLHDGDITEDEYKFLLSGLDKVEEEAPDEEEKPIPGALSQNANDPAREPEKPVEEEAPVQELSEDFLKEDEPEPDPEPETAVEPAPLETTNDTKLPEGVELKSDTEIDKMRKMDLVTYIKNLGGDANMRMKADILKDTAKTIGLNFE